MADIMKTAPSPNPIPQRPVRRSSSQPLMGRSTSGGAFASINQTPSKLRSGLNKSFGPSPVKYQATNSMLPFMMSPSQSPQPKKTGFNNIGNTCYINAVLSAVRCISCFINDLVDNSFVVKTKNDGGTLAALIKIVQQSLTKDRGPINPKLLKDAVAQHLDCFASYRQQDADEFMRAVLQQSHTEAIAGLDATITTPHNTPSPMQRNFQWEIKNERTCQGCGIVKEKKEDMWTLNLSLPEPGVSMSVQQLFDDWFKGSTEELHCEHCGHNSFVNRPRITMLPRVLVLVIMRFKPQLSAEKEFIGLQKRMDRCPLTFKLETDKHCIAEVMWPPAPQHHTRQLHIANTGTYNTYDLISFALHFGERANAGHYKCAGRESNGQWKEYDDVDVRDVTRAQAQEDGAQNAYLLFYQYSDLYAIPT